MATGASKFMTTPRPSPNIWNHPETYEVENRAFDRGEYVAASGSIHSKLQKLVAGALR